MKFVKKFIKYILHLFGLQIVRIQKEDSEKYKLGGNILNNCLVVYDTRLEPLDIVISSQSPKRVNILFDKFFSYLSGGSISNYYLAWYLHKRGFNIRCVVTAPNYSSDIMKVQKEVVQWEGLNHFFDSIQFVGLPDENHTLEVNSGDRFIARSWWTAHVAYKTTRKLGSDKSIFFTQDFEPIFHPHNWQYVLALEAYSLASHIIFSSELLRDYFRERKIGVFAKNDAEDNHCVVENAVPRFSVSKDDVAIRKKRKLLFFARPHMNRNLFELGYYALVEAINDGIFDKGDWEFWCIGGGRLKGALNITKGVSLRCIPWVSLADYRSLLPTYDLGLSLMLSPHPSLTPLDMAAAGLVTVTNTYETKTADRLSAISSNLIGVPPTIQGIKQGLGEATGRVEDAESRIAGTDLKWAKTWDETFNDKVMNKIVSWLD